MAKLMNQDEFVRCFDEYADALFRHCFFRVYDREIAHDLVQDTFLKTWEYIASGNTVDNPKAFLYRVASNLVIDHVRRKKSVSLEELSEAGHEPVSADKERIEVAADFALVFAALDRLDSNQRQVIVWRYIDGLSPKEIGAITGQSENVVSVRLHRAIKKLKQLFPHEQEH